MVRGEQSRISCKSTVYVRRFDSASGFLCSVSDQDTDPNPDCIRIYFLGQWIWIRNPDQYQANKNGALKEVDM